jgi:hypothetical protein
MKKVLTEFLEYMKQNHKGDNPLPRTFMSSDEIKSANKLVKMGLLTKGKTVENNNVMFYAETNQS